MRGAGFVDEQDASPGCSLDGFYRRQLPCGSAPAAELLRQLRAHCGDVEIAHDRQDQAVAAKVILVVLHECVVRDTGQRLFAAVGRVAVRVVAKQESVAVRANQGPGVGALGRLEEGNRAPLFLAQACYPALKQSSGCIINLIDIYASLPLKHHSVYCSAKAANQMLVKSLALELAPEVRVNGISPGAILWPTEETNDQQNYKKALLEQIPLKRRGTPRAIADTALFLATNDYVTGEIIRVDGGRLLSA